MLQRLKVLKLALPHEFARRQLSYTVHMLMLHSVDFVSQRLLVRFRDSLYYTHHKSHTTQPGAPKARGQRGQLPPALFIRGQRGQRGQHDAFVKLATNRVLQ